MKNLTDFNETSYRFRRDIWITDIAISSILAVFSLYLLIALVYHQIKVETPRTEGFLRLSLGRRYSLLSKYTCISIAVASIIRQVGSIGGFLVADNIIFSNESIQHSNAVDVYCDVLPPIGNFGLTAGSGLVYLFLWFRQRVFYVHSSLKVINSTCLQIFSTAIIIVWILFWISLYFVYFIKVSYRYDKAGVCQYVLDTGRDWTYGEIIVVWSTASGLMQISLLGLFIYPLIKRASWLGSPEDGQRLMQRVKKAIKLASICLGTDILSGVILAVLHEENTNTPIFSYSVNLVINHLATIACFDTWKKLLWPWSARRHVVTFSVLEGTPLSVCSPQTQYMTDIGAHTSIVEPRSSPC